MSIERNQSGPRIAYVTSPKLREPIREFVLEQGPRINCRATLWRRTAGGWKVLYHRGTVVEPQA